MWTLRSLIDSARHTQAHINEKWVPARPLRGGWLSRLKDAWKVFTDRADAVEWPENQ